MKLIKKFRIIMFSFTLTSIIFVSILLNTVNEKNYMKVEEVIFNKLMETFENTIVNEIYTLEYILNDWAIWNATYEYINGNRSNYIKDNISTESYRDLNIDYIAIFNENMELLYGFKLNKDTGQLDKIENNIVDIFRNHVNKKGMILVEDKLILYSSSKITKNDGLVPAKGLMVFARNFDEKYKEEIEEKSKYSIEVVIKDSTYSHDYNFLEYNYGIRSVLEHKKNLEGVVNVYIPILNMPKEAVFKIKLENSVQILGKKHAMESVLMVFIMLGILGVLMSIIFKKVVISRIIILNSQINKIKKSKNMKERVDMHGRDELGELSYNINDMLNQIDSMHREVYKYATYDSMTGAFNRREGLKDLSLSIEKSKKDNRNIFIIYMDIDGLKSVNDIFGHKQGDQLIIDAVSVVDKTIDFNKKIVRLGGDEFLIILEDIGEDDLEKLIFSIKKNIIKFNDEGDRDYLLSISFGTAQYADDISLDSFVEIADKEMYKEKRKIKN